MNIGDVIDHKLLNEGYSRLFQLYEEDPFCIHKIGNILSLLETDDLIVIDKVNQILEEALGEEISYYLMHCLNFGIPNPTGDEMDEKLKLELYLLVSKYETLYTCAKVVKSNPLNYINIQIIGDKEEDSSITIRIKRADRNTFDIQLSRQDFVNVASFFVENIQFIMRESDGDLDVTELLESFRNLHASLIERKDKDEDE